MGLNTLSSRAKSRDPVAPAKGSSTGSLDFARDDGRPFRRKLNRWFLHNKRDLPWRRSRDPYAILVSEIMLQQTQAATVVPYYNRWLRRFPTIRSLAATTESNVLHAWQGLGYYARARNLHRCAKMIVEKFGGRLPNDPSKLKSLPGIGLYTANAITVFALNRSLPIVEANTARVLTRLFNIRAPIDSTHGRQELWKLSAKLVPQNTARDFQNAMMDLGALICTAHNPRCQICPVKEFCCARDPASLPRKRKRAAIVRLTESHSLSTKEGAVLLERCHHRWRGMWMLPPLKLDGLKPSILRRPIYVSAFPFTHHRVKLRIFRQPAREIYTGSQRWFRTDALGAIPIPSPHRRAINALLA
ncbi:MAG: A/G-specific adenine glycosylase [Verrucomicrobia bacterium]|nr:MAG: A/G-specific adenine glycosylase [Verrucomicrobiota bacterium]